MPSYQPLRYEQIMPRLLARVVARSGLTDVADSSVFKHILAATARELDQLYYQSSIIGQLFSIDTAQGPDLDARAREIQPGILSRNPPASAVGTVVFSRNIVSGSVSIPQGTQVRSGSGQLFATTATVTITPTNSPQLAADQIGQDAPPVGIVAVVPGSAGNVAPGTINAIVTRPVGVDNVVNLTTTTQGADYETDAAFRARIKTFIATLPRATLSALEAGVLGQTNPVTGATVLFSKAYEDPVNLGRVTLYVDDGTGTASATTPVVGEVVTQGSAGPLPNTAVGGELGFYLKQVPMVAGTLTLSSSLTGLWTQGQQYTLNTANGYIGLLASGGATRGDQLTATYTAYTGLVAIAQKVVDGSPADRVHFPGLRPVGTQVVVLPPQTLSIAVQAGLSYVRGYDPGSTAAAATANVIGYINGLSIGATVQVASIVQTIMETPGVQNTTLVSPQTDLYVSPFQLARTSAASVAIS